MSLDINKLENIRKNSGKTIARCPACAEEGKDNKGEHLFIDSNGRFSCILYPGKNGAQHRKQIFKLAGIRVTTHPKAFEVKTPKPPTHSPKKENILGRLGRLSFTHAGKTPLSNINNNESHKESATAVPAVPQIFTPEERRMLAGIDQADLDKISMIKNIFDGTVIGITATPLNDLGKNFVRK